MKAVVGGSLEGVRADSPVATPGLATLGEALAEVQRLCPTSTLLCLPWMQLKHPIHPFQQELMSQYAAVDRLSRAGRRGWRPVATVGRVVVAVGYAAYLGVRVLALRWKLRRELAVLRRQSFELVAKTWWFGADRLGNGDDFYFGDLQRRLAERGVRMLLLGGDARGARVGLVANASTDASWQLPELCLVPPWAPFAVVFQQMLTWVRLARSRAGEQHPLVRRIVERAREECLSRQITPAGLYAWIAAQAVRRWRPRAFLTLYEGHGWERSLFRGVKAEDPVCRTVGYQHTAVHPCNLALRGRQAETAVGPRPDVVLCLGALPQAMLRASHPRSLLLPFGTFRSQGDLPKRPRPALRTVLVLPEGRSEEELLLFNCALRVAARLPEYRFVLRCHPFRGDPAAFFRAIRSSLERDPATLGNVELAGEGGIAEEFDRSSVIVYGGSSSVFYAVRHGLKPVHVRAGRGHEVDPLFELSGWREAADSAEAVEEILRRFADRDPGRAEAEWRPAWEYVADYAIPVTASSLDGLLGAVGLAGAGAGR